MSRAAQGAVLVVLLAVSASGCPWDREDAEDGGVSDADGGSASDASVGSDAAIFDAGGPPPPPPPPGEDASAPPTPDGGEPSSPDSGTVDGGSSSPPDAGSSCSGDCGEVDLVIAFPSDGAATSLRHAEFTEDSCEVYEGCVNGLGPRALLELDFTLGNVGDAPLELGRPFESPYYYPSFCQDSYVIDGLFEAELRDASGDVVASGRLSTSCIAGESGSYTCRTQGLAAGDGTSQPLGRCDFLDVTGLPEGDYTLVVTANPDRLLPESDYGNNSAELSFTYTPCEGTVCGSTCCPQGVGCYQGGCLLPDLRINQESAAESLWITHEEFGTNSCELEEMCVNGDGVRRLLQFEGRIENWGPGDLNPGPEAGNPLYEFSDCHGHYHFSDFTDYRLVNTDGSVAAFGHKQSFCLVDMAQVEGATGPAPPGTRPPPGETGCSFLSAGWADIYGVGTPCQWVDITDVPPGDYLLELTVNPLGVVDETDTTNNVVQIPVQITEDVPCEPEPEICGDAIDQDCDEQPDAWDPDCQVCYPGDPYCEHVEQVSDNATCETAFEMTESGSFESWIEDDDAGEVAPACGGDGGDVFFAFNLDSEQAVYLGTDGSNVDSVLALYETDCEGALRRCVDDSCSGPNGQFVDILPAGHYLVAVKAREAGDVGSVRLKFQHADAHGAIVVDAPGVYVGDTSTSDDSVQVCESQYQGPDEPSLPDAGPPPSEEECVHMVEDEATASHECLHCACGLDSAAVAACDSDCWSLIDCVREECGGDGTDVACITSQCASFLGSASAAQAVGPILRMCPDECGLGSAADGGVSVPRDAGGIVIDGGMGHPAYGPAPDDIYVVAGCYQRLVVSTCGTSSFESVIDVRAGSLDGQVSACSGYWDSCAGDTLGTAIDVYTPNGLTFVVVDGANEAESGEYQMSVIY